MVALVERLPVSTFPSKADLLFRVEVCVVDSTRACCEEEASCILT
jgi:hypothetical protein